MEGLDMSDRQQVIDELAKGVIKLLRTQTADHSKQDKQAMMADLRTLMSLADRDGLRSLQQALAEKRVVRGWFQEDESRGCLVYFALGGISSDVDLARYNYPSQDAELAVERTIERWDDRELSRKSVKAAIKWALDERRRANQLEEQAIARCRQRCG
jgi:hypothetical protein